MTTGPDERTQGAGRWGKIPAWWLDHPDLDADGFAVLAALATFADEQGICWPSQSTLATKLKRSRPTINRILQRLDEIGLVTIEHRRGRDGARLSCLYRLRIGQRNDELMEAVSHPVEKADRDDSQTNGPCSTASQEQLHSEQILDSLASGTREPMCDVPDRWIPTVADLAWAQNRFGMVDLNQHVEGFVLRCRAHGYRYRDISAAWRAWLVQDVAAGKAPAAKTGKSSSTAPTTDHHPREGAAEQRLNAWMAVAARLQGSNPSTRS